MKIRCEGSHDGAETTPAPEIYEKWGKNDRATAPGRKNGEISGPNGRERPSRANSDHFSDDFSPALPFRTEK